MLNSIISRIVLDVFSRGSFFLVNILIARSLSVNDFGKFGYAISIGQIFYIFTDLGTHLLLIKELGESRSKNNTVWTDYFSLKTILLLTTFILYLLLLKFIWRWDSFWVPVFAIFWMFSNSLHDFTQSVCNGLDRVDVARNLLLVQRGISFVVIILFIWFSKNLVHVMMGLAVAGVLGGSISFLLFLKTMKSKISWKINKKEAWRIFRKSFPIGIGGVFGIFYMRWGHILCAWELTPKNLGDYSAAFRIFEFSFIIPAAIMNIGVPHLSESLKIGFPEFQRRYKKLLLLILPIGFLWGAFLILGAKPIVYLLFGQKYFEAVGPLRWLGAAGALVFINYAITHVLIIINRQTRNAVHEFIVFVMIFIFSIAFIPSYGITGAAVSIVLGELILMVLTLYFFWSGRHHIPKGYVQAVETTPAPPTF